MNGIQRILDRADRDGFTRRVRTVADDAALLDAVARPSPADPRPTERRSTPPPPAEPPAAHHEAQDPGVRSWRTVRNAQLAPALVASASEPAAEQYRALRTRIALADQPPVNVLLVTSPSRGEGKTLTSSNLALAMAREQQRRTCIVDADLRSPHLARLFGVPDTEPGLADVLSGAAQLDDALLTLEDHRLTVLPGGRAAAHAAELLGTAAMRRTLDVLRSRFDRVVIDTPAATLADVGVLAPLADGVLLVVRAGRTSTPAIQDAIGVIDDGKLLGIVLNDTV
jgi:capsular exopolysaccharide synthesis family protein